MFFHLRAGPLSQRLYCMHVVCVCICWGRKSNFIQASNTPRAQAPFPSPPLTCTCRDSKGVVWQIKVEGLPQAVNDYLPPQRPPNTTTMILTSHPPVCLAVHAVLAVRSVCPPFLRGWRRRAQQPAPTAAAVAATTAGCRSSTCRQGWYNAVSFALLVAAVVVVVLILLAMEGMMIGRTTTTTTIDEEREERENHNFWGMAPRTEGFQERTGTSFGQHSRAQGDPFNEAVGGRGEANPG